MELENIKSAVMHKIVSVEGVSLPRFGWDNPKYTELETPARSVMSAYQNANKWLDTLKEHILINLNLPYFSHIVHELAHTMPGRFDKFGDILHTENLLVPYPSTEEWLNSCGNIYECIQMVYDILDQIKLELYTFKSISEEKGLVAMSSACDTLISDIQEEYGFYYRVEGMLAYYGSNLSAWDHQVHQYYKDQNELI